MTQLKKLDMKELEGKPVTGILFRPAAFQVGTVADVNCGRTMIDVTFFAGGRDVHYLLEADEAASLYEGLGILIPKAVTANKETN